MNTTLPLHVCYVQKLHATLNRVHILFHFVVILALLHYRFSRLFYNSGDIPLLAWTLITISEFLLSFVWFFAQSFRWRPVLRTPFPERIPDDGVLPAVDVFICTADPKKEPTVGVMNTVLSAMSLDYPPEKLAVYLSDDGGAAITLYAIKEAALFARSWLPFCKKFGIKTRCPQAYFSTFGDNDRQKRNHEFNIEEQEIKGKYELFIERVEMAGESGGTADINARRPDQQEQEQPPLVEVINDSRKDGVNNDQTKMPLLVYVSRERKPSYPHRFKAGALNSLLRVSGIISNAPYLLVLDCDMYCNDPTSARQAMCFHLDPKISDSLAFVQFPQIFYNVSKNDIYDGQARSAYKTKWQGMDGLRGPVLTGTGYYLKRQAVYRSPGEKDTYLLEARRFFGSSNKFITSLYGNNDGDSSEKMLEEALFLASCAYENETQWGEQIGFSYKSLLESTFSGYLLHCKGWTSVYCYPSTPAFLGCTTIDMKDALVQLMKWTSGLLQVGLSRFCPLTYGMSRMSFLQTMCYGYFTFVPLYAVSLLLYAIVPQLCLLSSIPLYPEVSNPWFAVFTVIYVSSLCQHLLEVLSSGGSWKTWWNEQRIWMIKSVTANLFGCLDVFMTWIGSKKAEFRLTNKVVAKDKLEKYEKGKFDFEGASFFMVPLIALVVLNMVCFIEGLRQVIIQTNYNDMFGQVFLSFFILVLSYPIIEGIITRKGKEQF